MKYLFIAICMLALASCEPEKNDAGDQQLQSIEKSEYKCPPPPQKPGN